MRCLSAIAALRIHAGIPTEPSTLVTVDLACTYLRETLGTPRFETLWNEGAALTLDAALDLAIQHVGAFQTP